MAPSSDISFYTPRVFPILIPLSNAYRNSHPGIAEMEVMGGTPPAPKRRRRRRRQKKAALQQPTPAASSSTEPANVTASSSKKATTTEKSGKKSAVVPGDDDVLTFEQKKELSEAIHTLDGQKLERVIFIIHEGVPEIRDVCPPLFFGPPPQSLIHAPPF